MILRFTKPRDAARAKKGHRALRGCQGSARRRNRLARCEVLEARRLLAGDWNNEFNHLDLSDDGIVIPNDVLIGINELNQRNIVVNSSGTLPDRAAFPDAPLFDTSCDGLFVPLDVLVIINASNNDAGPPTIIVELLRDTAPGGAVNEDSLTFDATLTGTVTDPLGVSDVFAQVFQVDDTARTPLTDLVAVRFSRRGDFTFETPVAKDRSQDGDLVVEIVARDGLGNRNVDPLPRAVFALDSVAPSAPTGLSLTTATDSGISDSDELTNIYAPAIEGEVQESELIQLLLNGAFEAETVTTGPLWEIAARPLPDGPYSLTAVAFDEAGNPSTESTPLSVHIDTVPPPAPVDLDLASVSDTGQADDDNITSIATLTIRGDAESGILVKLFRDDQQITQRRQETEPFLGCVQ